MKCLFIAFIICLLVACAKEDRVIYFKDIGWTIKLPFDFRIIDSTTTSTYANEGKKILEESSKYHVNLSTLKNLIYAKKGESASIIIGYKLSNQITNENWEMVDSITEIEVSKSNKNQISKIAIANHISIRIDTSYSVVFLNGKKCRKFRTDYIYPNKGTIHSITLGTFTNNRYWTLFYSYIDSVTGNEIKNMLNTSKFDK